MNHGQKILALFAELKSMPEQEVLEKIRHFGISIEIFNGNYKELVRNLETHNHPKVGLELMSRHNKPLLHAYQREITRLLHNYIASSLSLTDHARNHYKDVYSQNDLFPEYQEEIDRRFKNNSLAVFIKNLRQYFQHYQMPGVSSRIKYTRNAADFEVSLLLPTKEMMRFSGWHSLSKEFLSQQTDDIDLLKLVKDYHQLVEGFYNWFVDRQMDIHKQDIERVEAKKNKIRGLEIANILDELNVQPKTAKEFEEEVFYYFPDEILQGIQSLTTVESRVKAVILLLKEVTNVNPDMESQLNEMYSNTFDLNPEF